MKKPTILQGEVKEFIDEIFNELNTFPNDTDGINIKRNFYSQSFKPEMITEYFEEDIERNKWIVWDDFCEKYYKQKTLSQFITNCIQAGIKLTWKK
jgi:hypothetical protein